MLKCIESYKKLISDRDVLKSEIKTLQDEIDNFSKKDGNPHLNYFALLGTDNRRIEKCGILREIESEIILFRIKFHLPILVVLSIVLAILFGYYFVDCG